MLDQTGARRTVTLLSLLAWLAVGCEAPRPEPAAESAPPAVDATPPVRPAELQGTIELEGMEEPMVYRLFQAPAGFPVAFSTYVPEDMEAETVASGEGDGVLFVPRFGGVRHPSASLALAVLPEGTDAEGAARLVREHAGRLGRVEPMAPPPGGALEAHRYVGGDGHVGWIALFRRQGHFLYLHSHAPAEMQEGLQPRVRRILEQWRWESDGAPLGG